jgi:hypothetical protein
MDKKTLFCLNENQINSRKKLQNQKLKNIMYHFISPSSNERTEQMFRHAIGQSFSSKTLNPEESTYRLRSVADQSYDLLSQLRKMEKLRTIGKLSAKETAEYNNIIRLVGLMIHLLLDQKYDDKEMMDSLLKRYEKYASEQGMVLNSPNI